jgi:hypothetical protein
MKKKGLNAAEEKVYSKESASQKKLHFGFSFSAADGELGNPAEDNSDMPKVLLKPGHVYNPNIAESFVNYNEEENELTKAMHISDKYGVGVSFTDVDSYLDK